MLLVYIVCEIDLYLPRSAKRSTKVQKNKNKKKRIKKEQKQEDTCVGGTYYTKTKTLSSTYIRITALGSAKQLNNDQKI